MTEKVILAFVILLVATLIACLIISSLIFTAAVSEAEPAVPEPELKVTVIYDVPMPTEHQQIVRKWCEGLYIDERLIYGIIYAESGFDPDAINPETGCYGYMQLNPQWFDPVRFSAPDWNLQAGILGFARLMCTYQDATVALLAYNNGETGAKRLIDKGVTRTEYTRKVFDYADKLKVKGRIYEVVPNE